MTKWIRIEYISSYNKVRAHTLSTHDLKTVKQSLDHWQIYPENILSITVDGKPANKKELGYE